MEDLEFLVLGLPTVSLGKDKIFYWGKRGEKRLIFFRFSPLGLVQKTTCSEAIWPEFSNPQFFFSRPRKRQDILEGGGAPKKDHFFPFFPLGLVSKLSRRHTS